MNELTKYHWKPVLSKELTYDEKIHASCNKKYFCDDETIKENKENKENETVEETKEIKEYKQTMKKKIEDYNALNNTVTELLNKKTDNDANNETLNKMVELLEIEKKNIIDENLKHIFDENLQKNKIKEKPLTSDEIKTAIDKYNSQTKQLYNDVEKNILNAIQNLYDPPKNNYRLNEKFKQIDMKYVYEEEINKMQRFHFDKCVNFFVVFSFVISIIIVYNV